VSDFVCTTICFQTIQRPGGLRVVGEVFRARKEAAGAIDLPSLKRLPGWSASGWVMGLISELRVSISTKPVRVAATSPASRRRPIELVTSGIFQSVLLPDSGAKRCTRLPSTSTQ